MPAGDTPDAEPAEVERLRQRVAELTVELERARQAAADPGLREREEMYRAMFEANPAVKLLIDPVDGSIVDANSSAAEYYGYALDALRGMNISEINVLTREEIAREMDDAKHGRRLMFRFRHRLSSGELREVEVFSGSLTVNGRILLHSIVVDVTERQRAEQALRASEARHRALIERIRAPVAVVRDGRVVFANRATAELLGYGQGDELIGKRVGELVADEQQTDAEVAAADVEQGGQGRSGYEWRFVARDRSIVHAEVRATLHDFDGQPATLLVAFDLTQRKRLEQQLRVSQRLDAVGRLAGSIAHDFNNLLFVVLNLAGAVKRSARSEARVQEYATEIEDTANRAAELTRKLLVFSRREAPELEVVEVGETVRSLERLLRGSLGVRAELLVDVGPATAVRIARLGIEQVLLNLVVNARDASPDGGRIWIRTGQQELTSGDATGLGPGTYAELCVRDEGSGMTEDAKAHAFEPFFSTKGAEQGTGLGLSIVYGIVTEVRGRVQIESEVGRGTEVHVLLPAYTGAATRRTRSAPPPVAARAVDAPPRTVLVVDDEPIVRSTVARILEANGFQVLAVGSGAEALARVEAGAPIDVVLSDVMMPGMKGGELARRLAEQAPALPVVLMSGFFGDHLAEAGIEISSIEILTKPFSEAALLAALDRAKALGAR